tara:strand:+ start:228 stop:488 length:261 start_codon:yes stop_codon:yes gene_type:complete
MKENNMSTRAIVLEAALAERERQDKLWGEQNHDDSWWNILATEKNGHIAEEIFSQSDTKLFIELIQTCATYFAWAESVRRRQLNGK